MCAPRKRDVQSGVVFWLKARFSALLEDSGNVSISSRYFLFVQASVSVSRPSALCKNGFGVSAPQESALSGSRIPMTAQSIDAEDCDAQEPS